MPAAEPDPYYDPDFKTCLEKCQPLINQAVNSVVSQKTNQMRRVGIDEEDLWQEARKYFWETIYKKYKKENGAFENYARLSLKKTLIHVLYEAETAGWPQNVRDARTAVWSASTDLSKERQRQPTPEEIAVRARISIDIVNTILSVDRTSLSWDDGDRGDPVDGGETPERRAERAEESDQWKQRFEQAGLDETECLVMELRQGLDEKGYRKPRPRSLVTRMLIEDKKRTEFRQGRKLLVAKVREIEVRAIDKLRRQQR